MISFFFQNKHIYSIINTYLDCWFKKKTEIQSEDDNGKGSYFTESSRLYNNHCIIFIAYKMYDWQPLYLSSQEVFCFVFWWHFNLCWLWHVTRVTGWNQHPDTAVMWYVHWHTKIKFQVIPVYKYWKKWQINKDCSL